MLKEQIEPNYEIPINKFLFLVEPPLVKNLNYRKQAHKYSEA